MEVEKTVSPKRLFGEPKDRPKKECPLFRCRTAGGAGEMGEAWVARPREMREIRRM